MIRFLALPHQARQLSTKSVHIGDISRPLKSPGHLHLVPRNYLPILPSASTLRHLKWLMAKDELGQDALLVGPPGGGAIQRRRLALAYAELCQREVELLTLTADITESDLKQRRELVASTGTEGTRHSVHFIHQAPVRAALHGRLLILDGLEKAERNVLPTLNNLLEHREMHLEDGRFLVSPYRYATMKNDGTTSVDVLPVHPDFRVIALAVPSPPWSGRTLDPPLRSRFQIRRIDPPATEELMDTLSEHADEEIARLCAKMGTRLQSQDALLPEHSLAGAAKVMQTFPNENPRQILLRAFPLGASDERFKHMWGDTKIAFDRAWKEVSKGMSSTAAKPRYQLQEIKRSSSDPSMAEVSFGSSSRGDLISVRVPCGELEVNQVDSDFVRTVGSQLTIGDMMQEHYAGRDILLISPPGEGKSAVSGQFAALLGYDKVVFPMYKDLSSRDLWLRRATTANGETCWKESPLVLAARQGKLCILDGVEKLRPDVLGSLQSFLTDREFLLPDGRRLASASHFVDAEEVADADGIVVHPSFRVIALASVSKDFQAAWLSRDVIDSLSTLFLPPPSEECLRAILNSTNPNCGSAIDQILALRGLLTENVAADCGVTPLSTRKMVQIVNRMTSSVPLQHVVSSVLVAELLPPTQRASLNSLLVRAGFRTKKTQLVYDDDDNEVAISKNEVRIGKFTMSRHTVGRPEMVPSPKFFDIPSHNRVLRRLLEDYTLGQRSFLLVGNQGVGKNMVVDRLCQLANFEREYIQLHRDSTVGQLTLQPSLEDGQIVWKDSPLVRTVSQGHVLVVDEADKAPIEVIAVLKSLADDGELLLADGRRISRQRGSENIEIHPNFSLWVLANRPGFPFLGNDFLRQIGDCFAIHVVPNPDFESECDLLRSYAPNISPELVRRIAGSFSELRRLSDAGDLTYPYSTREAVAVVKHLERFPNDSVEYALHNVLDFDSYDPTVYATLGKVFERHGFEMSDYPVWQEAVRRTEGALSIQYKSSEEGTSPNPPLLGSPKRGKWDEKNEAHVGGNQWAGGTGGSDTAGLGGRGGPYRLDRNHRVHQVSEQAKAQVSEEAAAAARAMAERALKERLKEINMSETEWSMYRGLVDPIRNDISRLQSMLRQLELTTKERGWIKQQSHGELDDGKLVDGVVGDKYIYKRRGTIEQTGPRPRPKRLLFVMDISGSMYRFSGYDNRLVRCLEVASLVMESFEGVQDRFEYKMIGHSGDSPCIKLIEFSRPPGNEKEKMRILQAMVAHSQYCQSGDHTLQALDEAIQDVATNQGDEESVVILISDANLQRYGIRPGQLRKIIEGGQEKNVKAHCVFIASLGPEADEIKEVLPTGRGHVCMRTSELPKLVCDVLTAQLG